MVSHRRKSWVLKSSTQGTTFTTLADGRPSSFYQPRRSMAGGTGVLNAPQVVVSVTDDGTEPFDVKRENQKKDRGTKHEHKPESPCSNYVEEPIIPHAPPQGRHSVDTPGFARNPPLPGGRQYLGAGQHFGWTSPAYREPLGQQSYSSRFDYYPPVSSPPERPMPQRAGSLDFWSSSLALAGLGPGDCLEPHGCRNTFDGTQEHGSARNDFQNYDAHFTRNFLGDGCITPAALGKSASTGDFHNFVFPTNQFANISTAAGPLSPVWQDRNHFERISSGSYENSYKLQGSARQAMDIQPGSPAVLDVNMQAGISGAGHDSRKVPLEHRLCSTSDGGQNRRSIDSAQFPFGSYIEDDPHPTPPFPGAHSPRPPKLRPIMMYSENLGEPSKPSVDDCNGTVDGSFAHGLGYTSNFARPPPPPLPSSYAFGSAIYHRSLYFEQFVLKDHCDPYESQGKPEQLPPPPATEHPDDYLDIPDYPTTVASCSNRSHLHNGEPELVELEGDMEEEEEGRSWLDELEERVAFRRKECTYRIACQRAFMKQMKDKLQASKLALNRLKRGLGPQLSEKVVELRMRFSSRRRLKEKELFSFHMEEQQYDLWAGPMLEIEVEVGYETDSSWITLDDEAITT